MFYHGIDREYVYKHFPILSARRSVSAKRDEQLADRRHLLQQFGLEPVHLLEAADDYPPHRCVEECFAYGDTVFAFQTLEAPFWQLSVREVGVPILDLRRVDAIYTVQPDQRLASLFRGVPIYLVLVSKIGERSMRLWRGEKA
ncbi:hypothetical protein LOK74_13630 [Brevibacillus humidisoli]|uniref:hypothetical protein n=1 Tax=Brevibacillus humidisoli TaxID=2895522 RepID=UPI001E501EFF|nr:hypothetical protein [Brevibacillus humidisoli]UFJ39115.1 hypothetical protein LOK74_13630 [Brevibacillus humidisoli]